MSIIVGVNGPMDQEIAGPERFNLFHAIAPHGMEWIRINDALRDPAAMFEMADLSLTENTARIIEKLDHNDVIRLLPGMWLNTTLMEAITLFLNKYERMYCHRHGVEFRMMIINQFVVQQTVNVPLLRRELRGIRELIAFKNPSSNHWITYVATFNHAKRTFSLRYYDSYNTAVYVGTHNQLKHTFCGLFDPPYHCETLVVPRIPSPQQPNGDDCGVFSLAAAAYLMNDPQIVFSDNMPYNANDIDDFRRILCRKVEENRILNRIA